ncbi:MAG: hypothetical protein KJ725_14425 [Gammaproteobacteria bacterium]|nr:hypothetical protein [Gammaproteobacteria bacterium]
MFNSNEYTKLSIQARYLMLLLQEHWRNDKPVAFGVREAADKLGCMPNKAGKLFNELQEAGFIKLHSESRFNTRTGSKAREWRLTWMPFQGQKPTHDWEKSHST